MNQTPMNPRANFHWTTVICRCVATALVAASLFGCGPPKLNESCDGNCASGLVTDANANRSIIGETKASGLSGVRMGRLFRGIENKACQLVDMVLAGIQVDEVETQPGPTLVAHR